MKTILLTCVGFTCLLVLNSWALGKDVKSPPNILLILADDMGWGDVSAFYPPNKVDTPHLDALAKEGMAFTDAHSSSAVCTPSRYGILTGQYCWRSSLKKGAIMGFDSHLIPEGRETIASLLKKNGYATAMLGKWHVGMDFPTLDGKKANHTNVDWRGKIKFSPTAYGFDTYYGTSASLDMPPYIWIENDHFDGICTTEKSWVNPGPAREDFEAIDVLPELERRSISYIESRKGKKQPFFLYLALTAPHTPNIALPEFQGKSGLGMYGDFCMQTDATIGKILQALEKAGLKDNTLVIFTSDNGCAPFTGIKKLVRGIKDVEKKGHYPSGPYRGYKSDIFEGGHHVPYIVRWPGKIRAGSKNSEPICLTDFMATFADILGISLPNDAAEDSVSLLPAYLGKNEKPIREAVVHHSVFGVFAIRQGKWKLELCRGSGGWSNPRHGTKQEAGLPPIQLYDMEKDPKETTNVYLEHPEVVQRLTALLKKYQTEGRSAPLR